jgi:hypothetical protein
MKIEKRKYTRFKVKDKVYAALGANFSKVGRLKDISMNGLAFRYIEENRNSRKKSSVIAIFHSEDKFFLRNLACIIVTDHPIGDKDQTSKAELKYIAKKCAVRFENVTSGQKKKLEYLIRNYTWRVKPSLNVLNA